MIPDKPPYLTWGPDKLIAWAGQIQAFINAKQVYPADQSIDFNETDNGLAISVSQWVYNQLIAQASPPNGFKCTRSGDRIRVHFGHVSNVIPAGMNMGDDPPFTVAPTGSFGVVCLVVTAGEIGETGAVGPISASIATFSDPPFDLDPTYYLLIGSYSTGPNGLIVASDGNGVGYQQFELCGGFGGQPKWWRA